MLTINQKVGLVVYIILIAFVSATATIIFDKSKKNKVIHRLLLFNIVVFAWLFFGIIETLSRGTLFFPIAVKLTLFSVIFVSPFWLYFGIYFTGVPKKYERLTGLVFIPPIITYCSLILPWTQQLVIKEMVENDRVTQWGPLLVFNENTSRIYAVICGILIYRMMIKHQIPVYKILLFVLIQLFPSILNTLERTGIISYPGFDLTIVSIALSLFLVVSMLFKNEFIEVAPLAFFQIFSRIKDAVIIFDGKGELVEYNDSAKEQFHELLLDKNTSIEDFVQNVLSWTTIKEDLKNQVLSSVRNTPQNGYDVIMDIEQPLRPPKQYYVSIIPILDSKERVLSKLIHLKDNTYNKIVTLQNERNRLSDDLHDIMGNRLNIVSQNLEYALKHSKEGTEVYSCIEGAYDEAVDAFIDLRYMVENLKPIDLNEKGLKKAIEYFIGKLNSKKNCIQFQYLLSDITSEDKEEIEEAIYFIIQETIHNAMNHGKPSQIEVRIQMVDNSIQIVVKDDGMGCPNLIYGKGLSSIIKRSRDLQGKASFISPEQGGFIAQINIPILEK